MRSARPLDEATKARVALPFAIVTLIWGSTWIVIRDQIGAVPPGWSVCYRFILGAAAMIGVALASGASFRLERRAHAIALLLGASVFSANFNLVYRAEAHVTSGLVAVTFALLVVYNAIGGRVVLGQSVSRPFLGGSALALAGIGLLFLHEWRAAPANIGEAATGIGLTLGALLFASAANVAQGTDAARAAPVASLLAWGMAWGALIDGVWAWAASGPPVLPTAPRYWAGVFYLGVIASALAFTLYFALIRRIGPARAGYVNVLTPVLAMLFSTAFEGYRWSVEAVAGAALVVAGLVVAMRARSPAR